MDPEEREPNWACIEMLDRWGAAFLKALDDENDFAAWLAVTPRDMALALSVSSVYGDIYNGGVDQCLWNSFGTAAPEAVEVLRLVGLHDIADLVSAAIARLGPVFPRDHQKRMTVLEQEGIELRDIDDDLVKIIMACHGEDERRINVFVADVLRRYST